MGTILLVFLILMLLGAFPKWNHSREWGYGPSGGIGVVLLILTMTMVMFTAMAISAAARYSAS